MKRHTLWTFKIFETIWGKVSKNVKNFKDLTNDSKEFVKYNSKI